MAVVFGREEMKRELKVIQRHTGKEIQHILEDAVMLLYQAWDYDIDDNEERIAASERESFRKLIFTCNGSVQEKGRLFNILYKNGIKNREALMNAGLGNMLGFMGLNKKSRAMLTELIGRLIVAEARRISYAEKHGK